MIFPDFVCIILALQGVVWYGLTIGIESILLNRLFDVKEDWLSYEDIDYFKSDFLYIRF